MLRSIYSPATLRTAFRHRLPSAAPGCTTPATAIVALQRPAAAPATTTQVALGVRSYAKKTGKADNKKGGSKQQTNDAAGAGGWEWTSDKLEAKMANAVEHLKKDFAHINVGKASPALLDRVLVKTPTGTHPLDVVAQITIKDPHTLMAIVPEQDNLKHVESAIRAANLNLNPLVENKNTLKIPIPKPSQDTRAAAAKRVQQSAEQHKALIRNARHDELVAIKKMKATDLSTDDKKALNVEVEKVTKTFIDQCDALAKVKTKEVMGTRFGKVYQAEHD
ncbi:ribosome recycling factor domain-containing protein [Catenaria anguillulae PL171]|uniref:Ribosome recycling factor domain-containing protein n=1 Tax=Catenaria anguillulae PL171 TaxID=765915 RepID=A0A1Y2I2Y2_9FUNG|nr:ribosome recycling factor domain-containing protein [Catenaria anguillulae PL171]